MQIQKFITTIMCCTLNREIGLKTLQCHRTCSFCYCVCLRMCTTETKINYVYSSSNLTHRFFSLKTLLRLRYIAIGMYLINLKSFHKMSHYFNNIPICYLNAIEIMLNKYVELIARRNQRETNTKSFSSCA